MSKQRRIFGLGLLTGAAIGFWLNSEKGKAFRADVSKVAGEYSEELSAIAKENARKLSSNLSTAMEDGQNWLSSTKGKVKRYTWLAAIIPTKMILQVFLYSLRMEERPGKSQLFLRQATGQELPLVRT